MPNISVAKPSRIRPLSFLRLFLQNMNSMMPTSASTGVNEVGLSSFTQSALLLMPPRLRIHAVTVVPTFAPIITLMACFSVIRPELTKPTTMTVVADELWITAVMPSPVRKPAIFRPVILPSRVRSLLPARFSSACPMMFMPNRNRQSPPIMFSASKILMQFAPFSTV